jgi:hypothetical protein
MPNLGLIPCASGYNDRTYPNPNGNYHALYTTLAYTDTIPLPDSSLGFLPNHTYQNAPRFHTYGQPKAGDFGYETPLQFPFRSQSIDMMPARATVELGADSNNLTNQLVTILRESFGIVLWMRLPKTISRLL